MRNASRTAPPTTAHTVPEARSASRTVRTSRRFRSDATAAAGLLVSMRPNILGRVKIDAALVSKVARLASLEISPEETEELSGQLTRIVEHFEELRAIPDADLESAPDRLPTPLRLDRVGVGRELGFAEANAPEFAHGHFVVPRVVSRND